MAPTNEHPCVATDHLILSSPRKFYKAYMHASHWQLRAFVHSPKPNHVHYLGWRDIYEVNTSTKVRKILGTLPFSPRCFTSRNGLLCCGGDDGQFSVLHLSETDSAGQRQREVDDALDSIGQLENPWLPPSARAAARAETPPEQPEIDVKIFGTQILNCITLWFPNEDAAEGTHNRPVAVIASNDNYIYIADLQTKELIQKLHHDEPVNMGKISPDGSLLIVVGDDPYLHVYKRKRVTHNKKICSASDTFEWEKFSQTKLPGQRLGNTEDMRGSFTGSFTHRYVAIGTQYGEVAVFEIRDLQNLPYPRPTVVFESTRLNTKEGAIRALQFNPSSSLDLLAITEDSGRVVVVDVRQFGKRQMLETDPRAGYEEVHLKENRDCRSLPDSTPATADPDTTDDESAYSNGLVRQERAQARAAAQYRTSEETRQDLETFYPHGNHRLTRDEMGVLLAMQSERRRQEGRRAERDRETAANSASSPTPGPGEPVRRSAPRSIDRLRAIHETLGNPNPMRTAAALDSALATHMVNHRMRQERRAARRQATGEDMTEAGAEADARETRTARAMAEMMAIDAANLREQASSTFFDPQALRDRGMHRTASAVVRITNHLQQAELLDRARREGAGDGEEGEREAYVPVTLRRPMERREPRMVDRPRSPELDADGSVTVRLPATIEAGSVDPSPPLSLTAAGILGEGRRYRVPTAWGGPTMRSLMADPDYPSYRSSDAEESLSPEARALLQQRREARERTRQTYEENLTRRQQSLGWIPPENVAHSASDLLYARATPTHRNQTTGCAWSPDGRTLFVGTEGGLYEYQVDVANRKIHPAFQLR